MLLGLAIKNSTVRCRERKAAWGLGGCLTISTPNRDEPAMDALSVYLAPEAF